MSLLTAVAAPPFAFRPSYRHLARLSTVVGLFEHALHDVPRPEHGYCADDVARALVVVVREPDQTPELAALTEVYLRFLEAAVGADGRVRNRRDAEGRFTDEPTLDDCWGRTVGALGFTAAHADIPFHRTRATFAFLRAANRRSTDVRASAFAVLGAAEFVRHHPDADAARRLITASLDVIPTAASAEWDWPEPRLRYANATICEALIVGGAAVARPDLVERGLAMLDGLLRLETGRSGDLSPTGSHGRSPGESGPLWDQQPIEVAAIADACAAAFAVSHDARWRDGVRRAWRWFLGANDVGIPMYDPQTGAGYDGLEPTGRNGNRGAESTLAALGTLQRARALGVA